MSNLGDHSEETEFDPKSIYNPVHQKKLADEDRAREKSPGEILRSDDGGFVFGCNRFDGVYIKYTYGTEQLEEDLATFESTGTHLAKEDHEAVIRSAFISILEEYGKFFDDSVIQRIFPGINIKDLQSYDYLANSRIKIFVLGQEGYVEFMRSRFAGTKGSEVSRPSVGVNSSSKLFGVRNSHDGLYGSSPVYSELTCVDSDRDIIVLNETGGFPYSPSPFSEQNKKYARKSLIDAARHEILHSFSAGYGFPIEVLEGIVEFYSIHADGSKGKNLQINTIFNPGLALVSKVVTLCARMGLQEDEICKALLTSDPSISKKVVGAVKRAMGKEFASDFFIRGFAYKKDAISDAIRKLDITLQYKHTSVVLSRRGYNWV